VQPEAMSSNSTDAVHTNFFIQFSRNSDVFIRNKKISLLAVCHFFSRSKGGSFLFSA
jgi:hypothetical protein